MAVRFWVLFLVSTSATFGPPVLESEQDADTNGGTRVTTPAIATKWTEPENVVYLEHTGAYWTAGRLFRQVREHMDHHSQPGPMYTRYSSDPSRAPLAGLRIEIGFAADAKHQPSPPFKIARRAAEFVACTVIEGRAASPRTDYPPLFEWIDAREYEPLGPIIEVYNPPAVGQITNQRQTEICVVLRPPETSQIASPDAEVPHPIEPEPPGQRSQLLAAPVHDLHAKPGKPPAPETETAGRTTVEAQTQEIEKTERADQTATAEGVQGNGRETTSPPPVDKRTQPRKSDCEQPRSISELVAVEQFECIALQLMPDDRSIPVEHQVWFGQVVFRVRAVAKGIMYTGPSGGARASALADAITRRYREVSADFTLDPLDQVTVITHPQGNALANDKRAIMRSLDTLMARISLASVDAAGATQELVRILEDVQKLLKRIDIERSERNETLKENKP